MTLPWPWALLSLLVVPLLLGLVRLGRRRRRAAAVRVTSIALVREALPPPHPLGAAAADACCSCSGLALVAVAAARPQARVPVASDSTTIMLAMDVSGSMCSTDVDPNRITVAQQAATKFIEAEGGDVKIGLVAFAGVAGVQVPPTTDTDALVTAIAGLSTARGTAIGSAILTSVDAHRAGRPDRRPERGGRRDRAARRCRARTWSWC